MPNDFYGLVAPQDFEHNAHTRWLPATFPQEGGVSFKVTSNFDAAPPPPIVRSFVFSENRDDLTPASCKSLCDEKDFPFYGLEWSIMCFCGGKETAKVKFIEGIDKFKLGNNASACDMPCPRSASETCGGQSALEIWEI